MRVVPLQAYKNISCFQSVFGAETDIMGAVEHTTEAGLPTGMAEFSFETEVSGMHDCEILRVCRRGERERGEKRRRMKIRLLTRLHFFRRRC